MNIDHLRAVVSCQLGERCCKRFITHCIRAIGMYVCRM